jgi:hypothetical protein
LDDAALLISCAEAALILVAFDRATLAWHAGQLLRSGHDHGGLILFRRTVRSTDYGQQARLLTRFWHHQGQGLGLVQPYSLFAEVTLNASEKWTEVRESLGNEKDEDPNMVDQKDEKMESRLNPELQKS